ncbi:FHA domain-containing protein [Prosthecodimorpha staleyi]|uniref:FHA domain-containing protein n=1 Tax=Prosthecodimorpha staleyi TaxID=2840188 RepID=A0A947GAV5_9HYPH|nr:FHA domain-containing protein [Prosthecodimorpha staleyi]MBT9288032.1 FHA domain-containing protein [Prosthecodimorpha staleyi]
MSDQDQDNEPTRIVQRPGPKSLPLTVGSAPLLAGPAPVSVSPRSPAEPARASDDPEATRVAVRPRLTPPGTPVGRVLPPAGAPPVHPVVPQTISPHPSEPEPFASPVPPPTFTPTPSPAPLPPVPPSPFMAASAPPAPADTFPGSASRETAPPVDMPSWQPPPAPVVPVRPSVAAPPPPVYTPPPPAYQPPPPPAAEPRYAAAAAAERTPLAVPEKPAVTLSQAPAEPVVGWVVVIKGPGRGASREVFSGRNALGSDPEQMIPINFGDPAFARRGHAFIVYDNEERAFYIEDGKQKELVRVNGQLLSETRAIHHGDEIRVGQTTLKFVALCGPEFDWADRTAPRTDAAASAATARPEPAAPVEAEPRSDAMTDSGDMI